MVLGELYNEVSGGMDTLKVNEGNKNNQVNPQSDIMNKSSSSSEPKVDATSANGNSDDAYHSSFIMDNGEYVLGRIFFFNAKSQFGFIQPDVRISGERNLFFHYEDVESSNVNKKMLRTADKGNFIVCKFQRKKYMNKDNKLSTKGINIQVLSIQLDPNYVEKKKDPNHKEAKQQS
jgi:cold shock CspA family protein